MSLVTALIYWVIISLWLAVLATVCVAFVRNPRTFGTIRLLLSVLLIDTARNIAENVYFGLYFGGQYGLFPASITGVLGNPSYLIIPKILNVVAATAVLGLLTLRWLPLASKERAEAEAHIRAKTAALNQEAEDSRRLFETSLDLILVTDPKGTFVRVSPSSSAILGYDPEEMIGRSGAEFILPKDLDGTRREMRLGRSGQHKRNFETRYIHKDGHVVPLVWSGVWCEPEQRYFFFGRDMTERKAAEEQLRRLALYDPLTDLPNRTSLRQEFRELFEDSAGAPFRSMFVAMLDLDGFKDVNDTLGHSVGDRLLQKVARRLEAASAEIRVYRLGGDEFVLVHRDCGNPLVATELVASILKRLTDPFEVEDHQLFIAASAGIAISPIHGSNGDDLLANADLALYDAKASRSRTYRLYENSLRARANARRQLDSELRRACANQEFILYYQPQIRSSDGAVIGAEALLRWNHPERGVLPPGAFIDALSESAFAVEAGRWILMEACRAAAAWRDMGIPTVRIGVNLFPAQFRNGTLLKDVEHALFETGLPPEALELEITENIALGHEDATLAPLKALRSRGVGIAFDDFGTGYASLSYLTRYPLTRIKIDRSFVQKIDSHSASEDTAIVRSIIAMGHNLGLGVIAEGVETRAQAEFLRSEGCHELQGFLFSGPVPQEMFETFLLSSLSEIPKATIQISRLAG